MVKVYFHESNSNKFIRRFELPYIPSFHVGDKLTLEKQKYSLDADNEYKFSADEYIIEFVHHILTDWENPWSEGANYTMQVMVVSTGAQA